MLHPKIKGLIQVNQLKEEGKVKEALQIVIELEQGSHLSRKELLICRLVKANLLRLIGNYVDAIKIAKGLFQEFQKLGDILPSFDALFIQAYCYNALSDLSESEDIIKQLEHLLQNIRENLTIDVRERESLMLNVKANIHFFKGEVQRSLELHKNVFEQAKSINNKGLISACLNNIAHCYYHMKRFDEAIIYAKKAIKFNYSLTLAVPLGTIIEVYVDKGDIKEAKLYLDRLRKHSEKFDYKWNKEIYCSLKAMTLKSSLRARDRIKSEDLYKKLALDITADGELRIDAIINLCDLYLTELRITNDLEIINELHPYLQELLNVAKKQNSFLYLAETKLLQAKLSLLTLDIKKAKQFLTQAQKIAELYGLKRVAMRISCEHDKLLRQAKMWENLKTSGISLSERLKLTGLNEEMEYLVKGQIIDIPQIKNEESVLFLILTEGGNPIFSHWFIKENGSKDHLFGGFLTSINTFVNEMFSEGLNRASFGEHTLIMESISPFLICYIYKGASYYALQRVKSFIEKIQNNKKVWQVLEKFYQSNRIIQKEDNPSLNIMINKIFIEKSSSF